MTKRLLIFSLLSLFLLINVAYAGSPSTSGAIIMKQGISARVRYGRSICGSCR